jgi:hypothetical protein
VTATTAAEEKISHLQKSLIDSGIQLLELMETVHECANRLKAKRADVYLGLNKLRWLYELSEQFLTPPAASEVVQLDWGRWRHVFRKYIPQRMNDALF